MGRLAANIFCTISLVSTKSLKVFEVMNFAVESGWEEVIRKVIQEVLTSHKIFSGGQPSEGIQSFRFGKIYAP